MRCHTTHCFVPFYSFTILKLGILFSVTNTAFLHRTARICIEVYRCHTATHTHPHTTHCRYYLFTHIDFDIKYNERHVIEISVSTDPRQALDISDGAHNTTAKFTYSVQWHSTDITYEKRLQRYERFPMNQIHLEVRSGVGLVCLCIPQHTHAQLLTMTDTDTLCLKYASHLGHCLLSYVSFTPHPN